MNLYLIIRPNYQTLAEANDIAGLKLVNPEKVISVIKLEPATIKAIEVYSLTN